MAPQKVGMREVLVQLSGKMGLASQRCLANDMTLLMLECLVWCEDVVSRTMYVSTV